MLTVAGRLSPAVGGVDPRRGREPDQGAAAGAVLQPHQHRDTVRQPAAALLLGFCLRAAGGAAADGAKRFREPALALRHGAPEAAQGRRPHPDHPSPHMVVAAERLSLQGGLCRGVGQAGRDTRIPDAAGVAERVPDRPPVRVSGEAEPRGRPAGAGSRDLAFGRFRQRRIRGPMVPVCRRQRPVSAIWTRSIGLVKYPGWPQGSKNPDPPNKVYFGIVLSGQDTAACRRALLRAGLNFNCRIAKTDADTGEVLTSIISLRVCGLVFSNPCLYPCQEFRCRKRFNYVVGRARIKSLRN